MPTQQTGEGTRTIVELPRELWAGARLVERMQRSGALARAAELLPVERRVGYSSEDALVFLVAYFVSMTPLGGLRGFYTLHREWAPELGGLAGRKRLMSSGALSRFLGAADGSLLAAGVRWLLLHGSGALTLLQNEVAMARDAQGGGWHVFDFDPSRQAFRQRALPEDETLPPAKRRATQIARPGYTGRKRGEIVCSEGLLQHHGTGLWLDATVQPGNGEGRSQLQSALTAVRETCDALEFPTHHALLRTDGQFGNVPSFSAAAAAGVAYLSRVSRPELLTSPTIRAQLNVAKWSRVPGSGSGPTRYAADLGNIELPPGQDTLQADGRPYEPVVVRVVVSRYRAPEQSRGVGVRIGDEIFELFGSLSLSPSEWPASRVVALYYGRCAQECRFGQLDREFNAETLWAQTPGGQLFALMCLLFVWNSQVVGGVQLHPPLPAPDKQTRWSEEPAPTLPHLDDRVGPPPPAPKPKKGGVEDAVVRALVASELAKAVHARPGWNWSGETRSVLDPEGHAYSMIGLTSKPAFATVHFRRALPSGRHKTVAFTLGSAPNLEQAWRTRPRVRTPAGGERVHAHPPDRPATWLRPGLEQAGPRLEPANSDFAPARARAAARLAARAHVVHVELYCPPVPEQISHPLLQPSPASRRYSRDARRAHMAAPPGTIATISLAPPPQRRTLPPHPTSHVSP